MSRGAGKAVLPQIGFVSVLVNRKNKPSPLYRIAYVCRREGGWGGEGTRCDRFDQLCVK